MHLFCVCEFYVHVCVFYVYVCVFYGYVYLICILFVCMCIICVCLCMCMYVSDVPGVGRTKKYTIFLTRKQPANELILCICILGQWSKEGNILCVICMCILS